MSFGNKNQMGNDRVFYGHLQFDVFCLVKKLKQIGKLTFYHVVVHESRHGHHVLR